MSFFYDYELLCLFFLRSEIKETYYYGSSDDQDRRLVQHNLETKCYTRPYRLWAIVFRQKFVTRAEAEAAERLVKGWKSKKMTRLSISGRIILEDFLKQGSSIGCCRAITISKNQIIYLQLQIFDWAFRLFQSPRRQVYQK